MFSEDSFDQDFDLSPGAFAQGPVDGYAFADLGDKLGGDDFEFIACSRTLSELPIASTALSFAASAS